MRQVNNIWPRTINIPHKEIVQCLECLKHCHYKDDPHCDVEKKTPFVSWWGRWFCWSCRWCWGWYPGGGFWRLSWWGRITFWSWSRNQWSHRWSWWFAWRRFGWWGWCCKSVYLNFHSLATMSTCSTDEVSLALWREWDVGGATTVRLNWVTCLARVIVWLWNLKHIMVLCVLKNCKYI